MLARCIGSRRSICAFARVNSVSLTSPACMSFTSRTSNDRARPTFCGSQPNDTE